MMSKELGGISIENIPLADLFDSPDSMEYNPSSVADLIASGLSSHPDVGDEVHPDVIAILSSFPPPEGLFNFKEYKSSLKGLGRYPHSTVSKAAELARTILTRHSIRQKRSKARLRQNQIVSVPPIRTNVDATRLPVTTTGWMGAPLATVEQEISHLAQNPEAMRSRLSQFRHIAFEYADFQSPKSFLKLAFLSEKSRAPTLILDASDRLIILRSFKFNGIGDWHMRALLQKVDKLFTSSKGASDYERMKNVRGSFYHCTMGWSRSYQQVRGYCLSLSSMV
jgi:hypothetical protein